MCVPTGVVTLNLKTVINNYVRTVEFAGLYINS